MFIAGADAGAKRQVAGVLERFGWDVEDMGGPAAARAIEPLCMLWCIPGLRQNQWTHAFKLLTRQTASPGGLGLQASGLRRSIAHGLSEACRP